MLLSVIVQIIDAVTYLRQCLNSLLRQTCDESETILVDDGSNCWYNTT